MNRILSLTLLSPPIINCNMIEESFVWWFQRKLDAALCYHVHKVFFLYMNSLPEGYTIDLVIKCDKCLKSCYVQSFQQNLSCLNDSAEMVSVFPIDITSCDRA